MKDTPVLAVILFLVCFCISFGNGDERIEEARKRLSKSYGILRPYLKNPDTLRSQSTIYKHLTEVNDKEKKGHNWLQEMIGYSPEQLSKSPGFFMSEDELKILTEYHLWQRDWYHVRFTTFVKAARRDRHLDKGKRYPPIDFCRNAALIAFQRSKEHKDLYLLYYQALGEEARQHIMKEIKFPDYVGSMDHEYVENDAVLNVKVYLEKHIWMLLRKQQSMDLSAVKSAETIKSFLYPARFYLTENFMSILCNVFPVEDFSLPPNKASRCDREYLEMAWLLNRYRSLWYELRHNDFSTFLRHKKEELSANFIRRVEEAIETMSKLFQRYQSLSSDYHELVVKYQPDISEIPQHTAVTSHFIRGDTQIQISDDEGLEQIKWTGKRKRKTSQSISMKVSVKTHALAENQSLEEYLDNVRAESQRIDAPTALKEVAVKANGQTKEEGVHKGKQYKCLLADLQTRHQATQRKPLDEEEGLSDFASPTADLSNNIEQSPPCMELFQDSCVKALNSPNPSLWENCQPHGLIKKSDEDPLQILHQAALHAFGLYGRVVDNEGSSSSGIVAVETINCQPDHSLLNHEIKHETDAIEAVEREEPLCRKEIQEDFIAGQHETETRKRLETYPMVSKRRKLSSQTDDDRITFADASKRGVYGSTSDRSSERNRIPTASL